MKRRPGPRPAVLAHMLSIGGIPIEAPLALGPMAGVTDMAFRTICREQGAAPDLYRDGQRQGLVLSG